MGDNDDDMVTIRAHHKKVRPADVGLRRGRAGPGAPGAGRSAARSRAPPAQTGEVTIMRVKKGTPMGEVFKQYAEKKGLQEKSLSFVARARPDAAFRRRGKKGPPAAADAAAPQVAGGKTIPNDAKPMDLKKTVSEPARSASGAGLVARRAARPRAGPGGGGGDDDPPRRRVRGARRRRAQPAGIDGRQGRQPRHRGALAPIARVERRFAAAAEAAKTKKLDAVAAALAEPPRDEKSFKRLFDEYSSDVSYKQKYMDSNAFVVYYTKGFDGKDRPNIEDDPAAERQTKQFGFRNDAWAAVDDAPEVAYLKSEPAVARGSSPCSAARPRPWRATSRPRAAGGRGRGAEGGAVKCGSVVEARGAVSLW
ncbi:hypothetical protein SO694_00049049 [Aureococcus anophagefferens]|uniref:Uncharacterized protein n=1 Tax=Aureococcus anophagefferens TaxID=44056 RepID=A0ABR1G8Y4_AURAN